MPPKRLPRRYHRQHCARCGCWRQGWEFTWLKDRGRISYCCRTCDRIKARNYRPSRAAHRRRCEQQRMYAEAKRREAGVEPRQFDRRTPRDYRRGCNQLDPAPFRRWLRTINSDGAWCASVGVDSRQIRRICSGEYEAVHLDIVDRALTADGRSSLRELYPELYP